MLTYVNYQHKEILPRYKWLEDQLEWNNSDLNPMVHTSQTRNCAVGILPSIKKCDQVKYPKARDIIEGKMAHQVISRIAYFSLRNQLVIRNDS